MKTTLVKFGIWTWNNKTRKLGNRFAHSARYALLFVVVHLY